MRGKFQNSFRHIQPPLDHLFDNAGTKYRLQLNLYKYMLERYYGQTVAQMFIVCTHPDNIDENAQSNPFVDDVPTMSTEINIIMESRRVIIKEIQAMESAEGWRLVGNLL